jgi:hypothetical protein
MLSLPFTILVGVGATTRWFGETNLGWLNARVLGPFTKVFQTDRLTVRDSPV